MTKEEHEGGQLMNAINGRDILRSSFDDQKKPTATHGADWLLKSKHSAWQHSKENHLLCYCVFPLSHRIIVIASGSTVITSKRDRLYLNKKD